MYEEAQELHWRALWLKERYYGRNHVACATNLEALGEIYFDLGYYAEAEALHGKACQVERPRNRVFVQRQGSNAAEPMIRHNGA